ncbi:hypothetical protein PINS_up011873 [Pythium insidiosum]|nr:hypothetical protein PINS_up011873 [Pythium insidiosum]
MKTKGDDMESPVPTRRSSRVRGKKDDTDAPQPESVNEAASNAETDAKNGSVSGGSGGALSSAPRQDTLPPSDGATATATTKTDAVEGLSEHTDPKETATTTLRIDNFRRPFTLPAVKTFLQQVGPFVENGFWMNSIKTHCFVTFESTELAQRTKDLVHGCVWPPETGVALAAVFSSQTAMEINNGAVPQPIESSSTTPQKRKSSGQEPPAAGRAASSRRRLAAKSLDSLFHKTETKPVLYYLPVPDDEVRQRRERRLRRVAAA